MVLTGGASMLNGAVELAEHVMGMPVRIGLPKAGGGLVETIQSPIYATGVGLIYYALQGHGKKHNEEHLSYEWIKQRLKDFVDNIFG